MTTAVGVVEPHRRWWMVNRDDGQEYEVEIVSWQGTGAIVVLLTRSPWDGLPMYARLSDLRTEVPTA